jgi:hypothetical protein
MKNSYGLESTMLVPPPASFNQVWWTRLAKVAIFLPCLVEKSCGDRRIILISGTTGATGEIELSNSSGQGDNMIVEEVRSMEEMGSSLLQSSNCCLTKGQGS